MQYYEGMSIGENQKKVSDIDPELNKIIAAFKMWSKKNFFFEFNIVRYLEQDTVRVSEFPIELNSDIELIYDKEKFDTPFSHLLYFAMAVGRNLQIQYSEQAISEICKDLYTGKYNKK